MLLVKYRLLAASYFGLLLTTLALLHLLRSRLEGIKSIVVSTLVQLLSLQLALHLLRRRLQHEYLLNELLPKVRFLQLLAALSKHLVEEVVVGLVLEVSGSLEDCLDHVVAVLVHHQSLQQVGVAVQVLEHQPSALVARAPQSALHHVR